MKKRAYIIILMLLLSFFLNSGNISGMENNQKPKEVFVGTYINNIYGINLRENQFEIDFYIWFRWKSNEINPLESFDLVNGKIESKEGEYSSKIKGYNYAICRVIATVIQFWDIKNFPLDDQILTIEIEDNDNEEFKLKYIPDTENCNINPQVKIPGWLYDKSWVIVESRSYKTNYGDISLPTNNESIYSRFVYSISAVRPGFSYFLKIFIPVFLSAIIALLALFIKPTDLDPRFGLGVGAIFAAVASQYIISSSLPETNILTLADKLGILAIIFIFLSIAESIVSLKIFSAGKEKFSLIFDKLCFVIFGGIYLLLNILIILQV